MTRHCDQCTKILDVGSDYIEVRAIGVKDFRKLFTVDKLDFCSVSCLATFWSDKKQ